MSFPWESDTARTPSGIPELPTCVSGASFVEWQQAMGFARPGQPNVARTEIAQARRELDVSVPADELRNDGEVDDELLRLDVADAPLDSAALLRPSVPVYAIRTSG